jgi:protoporphyrinogen oxidase
VKHTIIIGAGPAGIGAALAMNGDCTVLERAASAGGLSCSVTIDGAVFDYGGHSFHSPHPEVRDIVFDALEMHEQRRNAQCFFRNEFIPYPFQKNYHLLKDKKVVEECREGLKRANSTTGASNFDEFLRCRFGAGISKHFMLPYNRKLWGRDLTKLTSDWTAERVAAPEGEEDKFEIAGGNRKPLQSDTYVAYPARGGFGKIFTALANRIADIRFGKTVTHIDPNKKRLTTSNGEIFKWERLVSTLPLPLLLNLIEGAPEICKTRASKLEALSLKLGLVVIGHPVNTEVQRIYCSGETIPSHKIAINHNSSPYLRNLPHHALVMEISDGPKKTFLNQDLCQSILRSLKTLGLIRKESEVLHLEIRDVRYAYPIPTVSRDQIVREIKTWLESVGIYSEGRFGEWAYINSDEALFRGLKRGQFLAKPRHVPDTAFPLQPRAA